MGMLTFETIDPAQPLSALPARLEQSSPRGRTMLSLLLIMFAALAMMTPFIAVTLHLIAEPEARGLMRDQPGSVLQLGLGLVVWTVLLGWPARRLAQRLSSRRSVILAENDVTVEDHGLVGSRKWTVPTAAFIGVAHHVRASLSGVRHELILLHDDPKCSILIAVAPRFAQSDIERVCLLLRTPEVPARLLYQRPLSSALPVIQGFSSQTA